MSKNMLGEEHWDALKPLENLIKKLRGEEGDEWFFALKMFLRKENPWPDDEKVKKSLLGKTSTVVISMEGNRFIAKEKFIRPSEGQVWINCSDNFEKLFLSGDGKIEEPFKEEVLKYAKLLETSRDSPIIAELGGEEKVETTLSGVYTLMVKQQYRKRGFLLADGQKNIFYVRDQEKILRAVFVFRDCLGWNIHVYSIAAPYLEDEDYEDGWSEGDRVFFRKS